MDFNYILGSDSLTVFIDDNSYTVNKDTALFDAAVKAIREKNLDALRKALDIKGNILGQLSAADPEFKDNNGIIEYNGYQLNRLLSSRVLEMLKLGLDIKPMTAFIRNLVKNPSKRAVDELFGFLEACKLPITADGHFLAYKRIREDYTDCHTGKFDNSVGQVLEMPRNQVDDNSERTCSYGFHACSYEYLKHFSGARIVVVKINPADVIVIPQDYNNSKMRICRYEVVDEVPLNEYKLPKEELPNWYSSNYDENYEDDEEYDFQEDYWEVTDSDDDELDDLVGLPTEEEAVDNMIPLDNEKDEDNTTTKINLGIAKTIRLMAKNNSCTISHLANAFGISRRQVKRILDNEAWVE